MRLALVLAVCASGAYAQDQRALPYADILEFYGGRGCTIHTRTFDEAALVEAGFAEDAAIGLTVDMVVWNLAERQGEYVVLSPLVCTIRLPDIQSELSVTSPQILSNAPYVRNVDEYDGEQFVEEGCFLNAGNTVFGKLYPNDADRANAEYVRFLATNIISGDLRFYSRSPLATPLSFQVTTGDCARAPNINEINESRDLIASGFGEYVRFLAETSICGEGTNSNSSEFTARMQGAIMDDAFQFEAGKNAWLFFEYDMITMAAGWHTGLSATQRGEPRPPLCHFPD